MTRGIRRAAVALLWLPLLSGCVPDVETITTRPGNYTYGEEEAIDILDIETNDCIGTLTVHQATIINDAPFIIQEYSEQDESGHAVYEDVTYTQLVQITYTFQNKEGYDKRIGKSNFVVKGANGERAILNPETKDGSLSWNGNNGFAAAFMEPNDRLTVEFTYDVLQFRHTALIELKLPGVVTSPKTTTTKKATAKPTSPKTTTKTTVKPTTPQTTPTLSTEPSRVLTEPSAALPAETTRAETARMRAFLQQSLMVVILILLVVVIILLTLLLVRTKRK